MSKLVCSDCGHEERMPGHCGRPMHKEGNQLVCWMGSGCGMGAGASKPIPEHHGKPMDVV